ncbi:DUF551 domain-containing protein [Klebsiella michiganensis]|uniref:DUF551 domain-containing protein n=1 Tax=Klebsiella michiganensis TaxID=1134687 RepID=UPI00141CCF8C|nr:DUF551 domain-containing protein [Klebsiella michiganensis]CAB1225062.1 hypothetical protein SFB9_4103 [Klebsiella michiganensis]
MTKSTITREQLLEIIETDHVQCGEASYLARMALAAIDSEAKEPISFDEWSRKCALQITLCHSDFREKAQYIWDSARATQQPAPVVNEDLYKLANHIASSKNELPNEWQGWAEELEADIRRAAMLQELQKSAGVSNNCRSNENVQDLQAGNSPVIPDGYVIVPKEPTPEILAVITEAIKSMRGSAATYARVLAAAPQPKNAPQNIPEIIPGWIPVSERMPESNGVYFGWDGKRVLEVNCFFGGFSANQFIHGEITHWMPLPAAPQEVPDGK